MTARLVVVQAGAVRPGDRVRLWAPGTREWSYDATAADLAACVAVVSVRTRKDGRVSLATRRGDGGPMYRAALTAMAADDLIWKAVEQ